MLDRCRLHGYDGIGDAAKEALDVLSNLRETSFGDRVRLPSAGNNLKQAAPTNHLPMSSPLGRPERNGKWRRLRAKQGVPNRGEVA